MINSGLCCSSPTLCGMVMFFPLRSTAKFLFLKGKCLAHTCKRLESRCMSLSMRSWIGVDAQVSSSGIVVSQSNSNTAIAHRGSMPNTVRGIADKLSKLLRLVRVLDAEDDLLCRTAGWRFRAFKRGRNSRSSAGWMWILGMTVSVLELDRLCDGVDVSRREGKRAWTICMVRTPDMMV